MMKKIYLIGLALSVMLMLALVGCQPGQAVKTPSGNECSICDTTFKTAVDTYVSCRNSCAGATSGTATTGGRVNAGSSSTTVTGAQVDEAKTRAEVKVTEIETGIKMGYGMGSSLSPRNVDSTTQEGLLTAFQNTQKMCTPLEEEIQKGVAGIDNSIQILQAALAIAPLNPGLIEDIATFNSKKEELQQWPKNVYVCTSVGSYSTYNINCQKTTSSLVGSAKSCATGKTCVVNNVYLNEEDVCIVGKTTKTSSTVNR